MAGSTLGRVPFAAALLGVAAAVALGFAVRSLLEDEGREVAQAPVRPAAARAGEATQALAPPRVEIASEGGLAAPAVREPTDLEPEGEDPVARLRRSADPRERFEGVRQLAATDPGRAVVAILEYIEDTRDAERALLQRLAAVKLLGELEGIPVGYELTQLYDEEGPGIRRAAAVALARHGDDSLVERELLALGPDLAADDGGLRARAAESVADLRNPRAVPILLELLDDPNSDVRAHALDGLWQAGDVLALPAAERLLSDPVPRVRERAERAVGALRALQAGSGEHLAR